MDSIGEWHLLAQVDVLASVTFFYVWGYAPICCLCWRSIPYKVWHCLWKLYSNVGSTYFKQINLGFFSKSQQRGQFYRRSNWPTVIFRIEFDHWIQWIWQVLLIDITSVLHLNIIRFDQTDSSVDRTAIPFFQFRCQKIQFGKPRVGTFSTADFWSIMLALYLLFSI